MKHKQKQRQTNPEPMTLTLHLKVDWTNKRYWLKDVSIDNA